MKNKVYCILCMILTLTLLAGCGAKDTTFQMEIENFCANIQTIDNAINQLTEVPDENLHDTSVQQLLKYLDVLNDEFRKLDHISFPKEHEYLEEFAEQANSYMTEAVSSYHRLFENDYSADTAGFDQMEAYARENYLRAYKRIQIILAVLQGADPSSINLD